MILENSCNVNKIRLDSDGDLALFIKSHGWTNLNFIFNISNVWKRHYIQLHKTLYNILCISIYVRYIKIYAYCIISYRKGKLNDYIIVNTKNKCFLFTISYLLVKNINIRLISIELALCLLYSRFKSNKTISIAQEVNVPLINTRPSVNLLNTCAEMSRNFVSTYARCNDWSYWPTWRFNSVALLKFKCIVKSPDCQVHTCFW